MFRKIQLLVQWIIEEIMEVPRKSNRERQKMKMNIKQKHRKGKLCNFFVRDEALETNEGGLRMIETFLKAVMNIAVFHTVANVLLHFSLRCWKP